MTVHDVKGMHGGLPACAREGPGCWVTLALLLTIDIIGKAEKTAKMVIHYGKISRVWSIFVLPGNLSETPNRPVGRPYLPAAALPCA